MSKIIKKKVGIIIPGNGGALLLLHPLANNDGDPFKFFHYLSMGEIKAYDIRPNDVISLEVKGPYQHKFLGVDRAERNTEPDKCEAEAQPVPTEPKKLNMRERINLARSAITGLNIRSAKKLFDDALLAAQEEAKIPAPEGSGNDGEKRVDAGSC